MSESGNHQSKWWIAMIEKYGSESAVREVMRHNAEKSKRNKGGKGGFASLDPKVHKELSSRGGKSGTSNTNIESTDQSIHSTDVSSEQ